MGTQLSKKVQNFYRWNLIYSSTQTKSIRRLRTSRKADGNKVTPGLVELNSGNGVGRDLVERLEPGVDQERVYTCLYGGV